MISEFLESTPPPGEVIFVSAFVALQTIMRIKEQVSDLRNRNCSIRFVVGIDLGGTSHEVLAELLTWQIEVRIIKHRIPGHTFHPKVFLFRWHDRAEVIIGSNNVTEGGFFGNYEGAVRISYHLPNDAENFDSACEQLSRFLEPVGPTAYQLTEDFLRRLVEAGEVPSEAEARLRRDTVRPRAARNRAGLQLFGTEEIEPPPPLPARLLKQLVSNARQRRRTRHPVEEPLTTQTPGVADELLPAAFYMTLPKLQGRNIPGEARIPLEAIELAKEFWGWPDEYVREVSPRAGRGRVYWNWRPVWRMRSVEAPQEVTLQPVRMYMYENSSDFRFYARPLVNAGANRGDLVVIRRIAQLDAEYECILARQNTPQHANWIRYCTQTVRNSTRRFGYA